MEQEKLHCPACRARQSWRDECRRCQADLRLLVRALRRAKSVEELLRTGDQTNDGERQLLVDEYMMLKPGLPKATRD
jgi:hypothetical protein